MGLSSTVSKFKMSGYVAWKAVARTAYRISVPESLGNTDFKKNFA
jgi:hypothetical protein